MKRIVRIVGIVAISAMLFGCGENYENRTELSEQVEIDNTIKSEIAMGYTIDEPLVIVNPYGTAALSAIVAFNTDDACEVEAIVKGHSPEDDIKTTFEKGKEHILSIYGLYPGEDNTVELVCNGQSYEVTVTTDSVDEALTSAELNYIDESRYDYDKITFVSGGGMGNPSTAYDSKGELRWISNFQGMPFCRLENGHFLSQALENPDEGFSLNSKGIVEIDLMGRVYNKYFYVPAGEHHDAIELKNGNLIFCTRHEDKSISNCSLVEIDRKTGEIVWDLDMCDLIDPKDGAGMYQTENNWFHNNGICYDEKNDLIILSSRQTDSVVAVKKSTKELAWILGDPTGWSADPSLFFTPVGDDFEWQYAQHNVSVIDEDKILVFDNGCARVKVPNADQALAGKDLYSRAVMFKINTDDMTVEQVWEYGKDRGDSWYSSFISGVNYDEVSDSFWIDSGGIRYDPEADSYDVPLFAGDKTVLCELYSIIDNVIGDEVVYELKLHSNSFRCNRYNVYENTTKNYNLDAEAWGFNLD